ncbi:hypothetical protein IFM89_039548 [Coptis chinensis]|uniref:Uncharacterized protein n=1 Tax=Coptis chinensis TaxID=261450 RepID=A0A835GTG2_9MAGN|nr:hypothetical protein IFM89_039548 [Coptis chinensis]
MPLFLFTLTSLLPLLPVFLTQITFSFASKTYVVYMGGTSIVDDPDQILRHHQMLTIVHRGSVEQAQASHVCSYKHGFTGFAAKLTQEQAFQMTSNEHSTQLFYAFSSMSYLITYYDERTIGTEMPGVVSVFPNAKRRLHTTHSWDFMGLANDEQMEIPGYSTKNQHNVIIGFIDTGIWPESPSFSDHDMPPVPSRWKGQCQVGEAFNASSCNRKVVGARYYVSGFEAEEDSAKPQKFRSPRDSNGHGSHTASIAAGQYVVDMNFKGLAAGGARGGAPMARIAVYKTCWDSGCYDVDLLSAFDDAIKDGVDVLSLSLGPEAPQGDYFTDAISIGSFHAASRGILVVSSVGNDGNQGSATNLAPWLITVAASSTDRDFTSSIDLGEGANYTGESLSLLDTNAPTTIIPASEAYSGYFTPYQSSYCLESSLNSTKASGKVVVCRHAGSFSESKLAKSKVVKEAGGVGMILIDEADTDVAIPFAIPAAIVGARIGDCILSKPTAYISPAKTVIGRQPAPRVASFSSKGPNSLTPAILKPDVTAPGLNILAAWSPTVGNMDFNILSGTSMACPHVTGVIALIKAVYPLWSPSAIKSALMTTVDPTGRAGNPFDYGAGFLNPTGVLNPGLVYDLEPMDYKEFLCSIGYKEKSLHMITRDNFICNQNFSTASDLNYPSITLPELGGSYSVTRTVTNVGLARSTYRAIVSSPAGVKVTVSPKFLIFNNYGQKISFIVNFKVIAPSKGYVFGSLEWKKGRLRVTSPLVVRAVSAS